MRTDSSFWEKLDLELQQTAYRAKKLIQNNQRRDRLKRPQKKQPSQSNDDIPLNIFSKSANFVRTFRRCEERKEDQIRNRMIYMQRGLDRKNDQLLSARKKYQKVTEIRNTKAIEKSAAKQAISRFLEKDLENNESAVQKLQTERVKIEISKKKLQLVKTQSAKDIRRSRRINEEQITRLKEAELHNKQKKVKSAQEIEKKSLQYLRKTREKVISSGRESRQRKVIQEYESYQIKKKSNQEILKKMLQQATGIQEKKKAAEEQLSKFNKQLGLSFNSRNRSRKVHKANKTAIFHLTQ